MKINDIDEAVAKTAPRTSGISSLMELELSQVYPNPDQPRKHFDPILLNELAESIKLKGLLQPISVVRKPNGYMIIAGERRWRGCQINEAFTIKCIVFESDDHTVDELALIENIQRTDLSDYEIAMAIVRLWESGKYTQKQELAGAIQKPLSYVSKAFGLLKLDPAIRADIEENNRGIGLSVLEELSRVDPSVQVDTYQRYNSGEIKRDDFKTAAKPNAEKISRGKKEVREFTVPAKFLMDFIPGIDSKKHYKITVEEIA